MAHNATFTTVVTGVEPFTYQWTHNGCNISGATGNDFSIPNTVLNDNGVYSCIVMNQYGCNVASSASLIVTGTYTCTHLIYGMTFTKIDCYYIAKVYEPILSALV